MLDTIYINGTLSSEYVETLLNFLWQLPEETNLTIYLTSDGGDVHGAQVLANYLNSRFNSVKFICSGIVASSAFRLLFWVDNAEIEVMDNCYVLDHLASMDVPVRVTGGDNKEVEFYQNVVRGINKQWLAFCQDYLVYNDEELDALENNRDVFISPDRFVEIVDSAKRNRLIDKTDGTI